MRFLHGFPAILTYLVAASVLVLGTETMAVTFADGQVHVIDAANSFPFEGVYAQDGPGSTTTTVNLVDGGAIGSPGYTQSLQGVENSLLNVTGRTVNGVVLVYDASELNVSGGSMFEIRLHNRRDFN